ncbi:hypothetical protein A4A49_16216 [Nicotiana attenuata]|uniref:Uncharacterized protein n=1 Tax=Nicotiana attenuata TaxID=49451 RepID=A0A1J6IVF4_NICAT|nr:hypothetical protein A4A49_16216 [Nicotiana attenuata]
MRLQSNEIGPQMQELKVFSDWILAIGDGMIDSSVDGNEKVEIPDDLQIKDSVDPISAIVKSTYPDFINCCNDIRYLQQRAILAPTLDMVESINEYMISLNHSPEKSYLSSDTICSSDQTYLALEHDPNTKSVASELPTSTPDESNILPIETTDVLATPATEEQVQIASIAGVLVGRSEKPNEVGDLGGGSEEIRAFCATSNQPNEVGDPDVPVSTSNESVILLVETSNVLTTAATEEQVEIASTAEALVARSKQPNEVGDLGGISEEIGALVDASRSLMK